MFSIFAVAIVCHSIAGWHRFNDEQREHRAPEIHYDQYLRSGDFIESVFENWESEFLQMAAFVLLASFLFQRGSAESNDPDETNDDTTPRPLPNSPWPVRKGGVALRLYSHSLTLALSLLFAISFALHALGGLNKLNLEALQHGAPQQSLADYLRGATFWFESFQNWQSEFLSVGVLIVLSIFLRERGSSQSKPVHAPHSTTGSE
jgi:hypothetical protein